MDRKAKLLFVDDEVRIVNLLKMMFRAGYEVFTATSGQEALDILKNHRIDVLVSDQRMPQMTGIELLQKSREISPGTMRILLTGYSDLAAIIGAVNEGEVYRFINKPWDQNEIKTAIAEAAEIAIKVANEASAVAQPSGHPPAAGTSETPAPSPSHAATLLVLDGDRAQREEIMQIFRPDYRVIGAASIDEALALLEREDVGVIVSDATVSGQDTGPLLRTLKQQYPLITTVMLTSSADCDLVIKLINEAQIFRFALKPIRQNVVRLAVSAAMKEHHRFRATPLLTARHKVVSAPASDNPVLASTISRALSRLRLRFSLFA